MWHKIDSSGKPPSDIGPKTALADSKLLNNIFALLGLPPSILRLPSCDRSRAAGAGLLAAGHLLAVVVGFDRCAYSVLMAFVGSGVHVYVRLNEYDTS